MNKLMVRVEICYATLRNIQCNSTEPMRKKRKRGKKKMYKNAVCIFRWESLHFNTRLYCILFWLYSDYNTHTFPHTLLIPLFCLYLRQQQKQNTAHFSSRNSLGKFCCFFTFFVFPFLLFFTLVPRHSFILNIYMHFCIILCRLRK